MAVLPSVTVKMSGRVFRLDEVMIYLEKNNLYQASAFLVRTTGMGKSYATKLAMAIRDAWQRGINPIYLSCALVGTSMATAKFQVRIDNNLAEQYKRQKEAAARAEAAAREAAEKKAREDAMSKEEKYVRRIHDVNVIVTDEVITKKLDDVEVIVAKILDRVAEKPDARNGIEEFYTVYLPMAVKIAEKYATIYETGISNSDIDALKNEIGNSLDKCNDAFRRLYERTYDDDVLNLSTEIAELNSRLAYDGLTKSDFDISE